SNLAHLERQLGQYRPALELYRETIVGFRDVGQVGGVAHQLECFGFIALAQNQTERAAELFSAAHTLRARGNAPMLPDEQIYFDEQLNTLRAQIAPSAFESAWASGSALTMDDAITFAIQDR